MAAPVEEGRNGHGPGAGALLVGLLVWLWPIGVGGRMPVGGDVTQFSLGLMAVLGRAIRAGRLPLWNDLWGYGFPGLAESQMGVFYPPHLAPLRPAADRGGVRGEPGAAHALGRARGVLGGAAVRGLAGRVGAGGVRLVGVAGSS